jgi:hypothetical protein
MIICLVGADGILAEPLENLGIPQIELPSGVSEADKAHIEATLKASDSVLAVVDRRGVKQLRKAFGSSRIMVVYVATSYKNHLRNVDSVLVSNGMTDGTVTQLRKIVGV